MRKKVIDVMTGILFGIISAIAAMVIITVLLQVFGRYVFDISMPWAETLARYAFAWAVLLGIAWATAKREHIVVEVFTANASPKVKTILDYVADVVLIALAGCLTVAGIQAMPIVANVNIPNLGITLDYIVAGIPVSMILTVIFSVNNIIDRILSQLKKDEKEGGVS